MPNPFLSLIYIRARIKVLNLEHVTYAQTRPFPVSLGRHTSRTGPRTNVWSVNINPIQQTMADKFASEQNMRTI